MLEKGVIFMPDKTTTIRFNEEEQKIIDLYMEFHERPFSTIVKEALMDDIADFFDSMVSEEAVKYNADHDEKYTSAQLLKELEIE